MKCIFFISCRSNCGFQETTTCLDLINSNDSMCFYHWSKFLDQNSLNMTNSVYVSQVLQDGLNFEKIASDTIDNIKISGSAVYTQITTPQEIEEEIKAIKDYVIIISTLSLCTFYAAWIIAFIVFLVWCWKTQAFTKAADLSFSATLVS